ncbi:hypothetical protein [Streptomyces chartreusis]|uniref:hypothetical protein n=1 Tax=Streptomyces chartreusis TaxID=1969 RepID=UPI00123DAF41|nr:hypothetical protein [Streptomyces chartreusis]QEV66239.1 hypothetical protein CP983_05880 [Streptomyces chartreusis]GGW98866.1 hypothetical protein GCM10010321_11650 [Streptomyces chartreusis]
MPYTQTAPDPAEAMAELIREHRKQLGGRYSTEFYTSHEVVGRFSNQAGATVEVRGLVKFEQKRYPSNDRIVSAGASAMCNGYGCVDPKHEEPFAEPVALDDNADETSDAAMPLVQKAREWAQAHAETCRAQAYTR